MRKVDSSKLAEIITHELDQWNEDVQQKIRQWGKNVANEGKQMLRNVNYPAGTGGNPVHPSISRRDWNDYSRNWKVTDRSGHNFSSYYIHNGSKTKPTYRLTHLLEFGHATRYGTTRTRAFPHIKPVEEWCKQTYTEGVEKILSGRD